MERMCRQQLRIYGKMFVKKDFSFAIFENPIAFYIFVCYNR